MRVGLEQSRNLMTVRIAQAVGMEGVEKRIDVIATALRGGMTVYDLEELELSYAPPFGSAKDPVNMAGFVASNVLRGDVELQGRKAHHLELDPALGAADDLTLVHVVLVDLDVGFAFRADGHGSVSLRIILGARAGFHPPQSGEWLAWRRPASRRESSRPAASSRCTSSRCPPNRATSGCRPASQLRVTTRKRRSGEGARVR